ncbi:HlyD family secretion protein [Xenorhabdus eapokensis]|uniref:Hemolysin secretion protein D n=1 Tax=Xenorhabdus eapokensis TaxID=1873482 RepID=A0A1Q5TGZ6_9GAMM|nr:HlyD family secretion protein [Xenorhabdus eapokensis]OKO99482.1 hemolysin secretion protein D [Xenorhabdus eapokensis]
MNGLFRQEAIEFQKTKWAGQAIIKRGFPAWFAGFFSLFIIIILILFLILGSYTRRLTVYGEVTTQPRAVNILSHQKGFISNNLVKKGDNVKKGTPIYEIDISRVTNSGKVSQNSRQELEKQIIQIEGMIEKLKINKKTTLDSLLAQKKQYEESNKKSAEIVENARQGVEYAKNMMESYKHYTRSGLITKDQLSIQTNSYYQYQSSYHSLYNQHLQESQQIITLNNDIITKATDFDNQISQYQLQISDIQRQLAETDATGTLVVNSPIDGRIESLSVTQGQMVSEGDSLAQIIPDSGEIYYLVLWLPNNSIPYVSIGDSVNISYDAFPHEKFGQFSGKITSISYIPASVQEMASYRSSPPQSNTSKTESYYKILVLLNQTHFEYQDKILNLSSGMQAKTVLFLEKRPIYQWITSPFYDIKKSLTGPVNDE